MKNKNLLFSIITVSFNSVKTIEKTIISVLNQTYRNVEYIIIDGGSTDGTVDIIKKYSDRIKYWISKPDKGISDAFNKGIMSSHGEIIGIINSDDWYELDAIQTIAVLNSKNNADFYIGSLKFWDNNNIYNNIIINPDKKYKNKITYRMPHLNHPASFFKREVYDEVGLFNTKYKYAMDYDFFLRVYIKNKNGYLTNKILSNMLIGGITTANEKKSYKEVLTISKNKILGTIWYLLILLKIKVRQIILLFFGNKFLFFIKSIIYNKQRKSGNFLNHSI